MPIRELVAIFDHEEELYDTIDELEIKGFDRSEISVLPQVSEVEETIGEKITDIYDATSNPETPRTHPFDHASWGDAQGVLVGGPFLIGALISTIVGAAMSFSIITTLASILFFGTIGGIVGYIIVLFLRHRYSSMMNEQLNLGGLVLWVRIHNRKQARRALRIFSRHDAHDVNFSIGHMV